MIPFVLRFIGEFTKISTQDFVFLWVFILSAILFLISFYNRNSRCTSVHYVSVKRPKIPMACLMNPFTFEVNLSDASFEGVKCTFSSTKNCCIMVLWGVPIYHLLEFLNLPWRKMKYMIDTPNQCHFLSGCKTFEEKILLNGNEKRTKTLQPPVGYNENEISCKKILARSEYPLVVVMVLQNESDLQENMMVAMATALHLPDSWMRIKPYVIGQFLKPDCGSVGLLRKTYLSSAESVNENEENLSLCIICYSNVVSIVILPCCHTCTCKTCFELCESCPVCRGRVHSYFALSEYHR